MTTEPFRKFKLFPHTRLVRQIPTYLLLIVLLTSSSCSRTDFFYSIAGWAVLGKIRDYFQLTEKQEVFLSEKIDAALAWHKKKELPKTVSFLKKFNIYFKDGLIEQELDAIRLDYNNLWVALMKKVIFDWATFLESVNSDQIEELPSKLDKRNEFLKEKLKLTDEEWSAEDADWLVEILEDWVGSLSKDQIIKIQKMIKPDRTFVKIRLDQRNSFHKWFVEELKSNKTANELEASFGPWVIEPESVWSPAFKNQMEEKKQKWTKLILIIDSLLTQKQRDHAIKKIEDYISKFEILFEIK